MTQNHYSFGKKFNITDDIYIYIYISILNAENYWIPFRRRSLG